MNPGPPEARCGRVAEPPNGWAAEHLLLSFTSCMQCTCAFACLLPF